MKLFKLILLYLFLFSNAYANTIYELIKIPHLEIYNIKTENKLRYLYAKQPFTIGADNNINCFNSTKQDLKNKYTIIEKNLNRYTKDFLKKINLKYIVLCQDLSISGIGTAGIPDNIMKTLIVDIKFNDKYYYIEKIIEDEVMLEKVMKNNYFKYAYENHLDGNRLFVRISFKNSYVLSILYYLYDYKNN